MEKLYEHARRTTTFLFAAFLWLHALFFLNIHSSVAEKYTPLLRLTYSELVLFGLLVVFSLLAASGFWRMVLSLAYIYLFPFVLIAYALYWSFRLLKAMNRWFKEQERRLEVGSSTPEQNVSTITQVIPSSQPRPEGAKKKTPGLLSFALRPFQRFMILWCVLLLVTTHTPVIWLCLVVVLVHLARKVFTVLRTLLFVDIWLGKFAQRMSASIEPVLSAIAAVSREDDKSKDLEKLWNQTKSLRKAFNFLKNPYLLSRWAWVIGIVLIGSIYTYFAVIFSFAYYGLARVNGLTYPWPEALVASLFIPFFITELPKVLVIKLLGGIQCTLVILIGVGTIMKFLRHRLDAICKAAAEASDRLADQKIQDKYIILEEKFSAAPASVPPVQGAVK